jgi:hypothetical protein
VQNITRCQTVRLQQEAKQKGAQQCLQNPTTVNTSRENSAVINITSKVRQF